MPVGVWNVRENVRMALRTEPLRFGNMEQALSFIESKMDLKRDVWIKNSGVLTDWFTQRRIEDFFGPSASNLSDDPEDMPERKGGEEE